MQIRKFSQYLVESEKEVYFTGKVQANKTSDFFNMCDIFVLPSIIDSKGETETLGVVSMEAMACEKPVVASNVGGIPDVVDNDVGFLVEPGNPDDIAEKLLILLKDKKLREEKGKNGRKKVQTKFSSEVLVSNLIEIYKKCVE